MNKGMGRSNFSTNQLLSALTKRAYSRYQAQTVDYQHLEAATTTTGFGSNRREYSSAALLAEKYSLNRQNLVESDYDPFLKSVIQTDWVDLLVDLIGENAGDDLGRQFSLSSDGTKVAVASTSDVRVYEFDFTTFDLTTPETADTYNFGSIAEVITGIDVGLGDTVAMLTRTTGGAVFATLQKFDSTLTPGVSHPDIWSGTQTPTVFCSSDVKRVALFFPGQGFRVYDYLSNGQLSTGYYEMSDTSTSGVMSKNGLRAVTATGTYDIPATTPTQPVAIERLTSVPVSFDKVLSLSLDGNVVLAKVTAGIKVYVWTGASWKEQASLPNTASYDLGDMTVDTAYIAIAGSSDVRVFRYANDAYEDYGTITQQADSLSINQNGDRLVIGQQVNGSSLTFVLSGAGRWLRRTTTQAPGEGKPGCAKVSNDGKTFVSASDLIINTLGTSRVTQFPVGWKQKGSSISVSATSTSLSDDGKFLVVGLPDEMNFEGTQIGRLRVYRNGVQYGPDLTYDKSVNSNTEVTITPDGTKFAAGENGTVRVYNNTLFPVTVKNATTVNTISVTPQSSVFEMSGDGTRLLVHHQIFDDGVSVGSVSAGDAFHLSNDGNYLAVETNNVASLYGIDSQGVVSLLRPNILPTDSADLAADYRINTANAGTKINVNAANSELLTLASSYGTTTEIASLTYDTSTFTTQTFAPRATITHNTSIAEAFSTSAYGIVLSRDGGTLAVYDNTKFSIYSSAWTFVRTKTVTSGPYLVVLSYDGSRVAYRDGGYLRIENTATGVSLGSISVTSLYTYAFRSNTALALLQGTNYYFIPGTSNNIELYNYDGTNWTLGETLTITMTIASSRLLFSGDGDRLAVGDTYNRVVKFFDYDRNLTPPVTTFVQDGSAHSASVLALSGNGDVKVIGTSTDVEIIEASGTTTFTGAATSVDVSSDGTRVLVGTSSKMYVVEKSGGVWTQLGSDIAGNAPEVAISPDGSKIFSNDGSLLRSYELVSGSWTTYLPDLIASYSKISTSTNGDIVAVGPNVYSKQTITTNAGYKITLSTSYNSNYVTNQAVSGNGNVRVITNQNANSSAGEAVIYEKVNGVWSTTASATFTGASANELFGRDLDVSKDGSRVVIGSNTRMIVVEKSGGTWSQLGSDISGSTFFVAISRDGSKVFNYNSSSLKSYELVSGSWTQYLPDLTNLFNISAVQASNDGDIVALSKIGNNQVYSKQNVTVGGGYSISEAASLSEFNGSRISENGLVLVTHDNEIYEKDSNGNWPSTPSVTFTGSSLAVGVSDDGTRVAMQSASTITVVEKPSTATTTYTVTVASVGGGDRYHIDGVDRKQLTFYRGNTYVFDLSDLSNTGHPLGFVTASPYTDGVVNNYSTNPPGSAGSQVTWTVPATAPSPISYYCEVHGTGMGTTNTVTDRVWAQIGSDITGSFIAVTGSCMTGDGTKVFGSSAASGATFTQVGSDIDGEAFGDWSGHSVSMSSDGTRVAIGAPRNDGASGLDSGHVRVYAESGGTWTQVGADIDGVTYYIESGFGVSLSGDGKRVAISAPYYYNSFTYLFSGYVQVFEESGGTWTKVGADFYGEGDSDEPKSVSMSGDGKRVAIGAAFNDGTGSNAGHVRVYAESGGTWTQVGADIDGEAAGDYSGHAVSISSDGTRVAIGAPRNDGTSLNLGHVRVYSESGGTWTQVGSDIDGDATYDEFGWSVSISGDGTRVAIGAIYNSGTGLYAGHVRVYEEINGTWTQVGNDIDGEAAYDESGWSVSMSSDGTRVAIGAIFNDGNGSNAGHVRVYDESGGTWTQVGADIDGEAAGDWSGFSTSLSGDGTRVAIGAPYNDGTGSDAGHVRVYSVPTPIPGATSSWEYSGSSWSQYRPDITSSLSVTRISHSTNGEILGLEDADKVIIYATTSSGSSYSKRHADASYLTSYHSLSDDGAQLISRGYDGSSSWNGTNYVYDGAGVPNTIWGASTNHFIEVSGNGNFVFHVDLSANNLKLYSKSISNGNISWTLETSLAFTYYPVLASGLASDAIVVTGSGSTGAKILEVTYTAPTLTAQYVTRGSTFSGHQISMSDDGSKIVSTDNPSKSSTTWNGTDYVYDGSNANQGAPWLYWSGGNMPMFLDTERRVFMSGDGNRVLLVTNDGFYFEIDVYVMLFYRVGNEWSSTDVDYLEYQGFWSAASINTTGDFFEMNYGRFYDILYDSGTTSDKYAIRGTGLGFASNHDLSEDGNYVVYRNSSPGAKAWNGTSWAYNGPPSTSAGWSSNHTLLALSGDATKAVAFKSTTNEVIFYMKDAQQQWSQSGTLAQSGVAALSIDTDGSIVGVVANGQTKFYTFETTQSVIGWGSHSSISGSSAPGFAQALDISNDGDTVVIGVAGDGTGTYRGEVRVYDYASSWIARATITPPSETGAAVGDTGYRNLGKSVSISDDGVRIAYLVDQGDYVDDGQTTHSIALTYPHDEIYTTNQYNAGYWGYDLYAWPSMIRLATGNDNNGIWFPVTFGAEWSVTFEWDPSGAVDEDMRFIFYAPNQPSSYAGSQHGGYYIEHEFAGSDSYHFRTPTGSTLASKFPTPYNTSGTFTTVTITYDNGYITASVAGSVSHSYTFTGSHLSAQQALWGTNTYIAISSRLSSINAHQYIKDINASWTVPNPPVFNSTNRSEASTRDWDGSAWVNPAYANDETTQIEIVPASDNNELDAISMSYDGSRFGVGPTAMVKHLEKVVTINGPFTRGWTARGSIVSFDTTDSIAATTSRTMRTSTDGNTVAFGYLNSGGVKIRVYGFASGSWSQLGSEISTTGTTISMDMSNDGTRVAVLSDATARVFVYYYGAWSQLGSSIATRPGIVKISGNGNYLAIGTNSPSDAYQFNTLQVYEKLADWELISPTMTLAKTPSNFFGVGFGLRDDGSQLVHYTDSGVNFSTFNTATVQTFSKHGTDITGNGVGSKLAFDNNGNTLVTSSFTDDIVRVYDSNHNSVANFTALSSYVKTPSGDQLIASKPFSITKDGNKIVTVAATGQVVVYKKQGGTWSQDGNAVTLTGDRVSSLDITNDGQRIIAGTVTETSFSNTTGKAQVFDLANGVWSQVGTDILPLTGTEHRFANVVAISDTGYATVSGQSAYNGGQPLGIFQTYNLITELQDLTFKAPTISLVGNSYIKLAAGSDYTELGAVVDTEASVVPEIKISGSVQSRTPGTYTLRYECEDLLRKKASPIFREVEVVQELPSFRLKGESLIYHAKDAAYTDAGVEFTGYASGFDFVGYYSAPNSLDASPLVSGGFTPNAEGDWSVYWTDQIVDRHFRTAPKQVRTIRVRERPAVSLVGDSVIYHPSSDVFTDPGSTVTQSGGFQGSIAVTGLSNLSRVGVFTGTYIAVDKFGIESVPVTRTVDVRQKPSITSAQTSFYNILDDPISVPTPTVSPSNLASLLQSSNNININAKGRYAITHTLTDSVGISAKPFTQQFFVDSHGSLLHTASGTVSALSRNGDDLAVFDTTLKTFRVSDFEQYGDVAVPAPVTSIKFTPDAQYMVVGMSSHLTIGLVRVYKKNIVFAGGWEQVGFDMFGTDYLGKFGESVDINSGATRIVVGAPEAGTAISKSGSVKIYDWTGFFWQQSSFVIEGTIPSQFLGFSVSLDNEGVTLAVGSPGHSRTTVSGATVTTTNVGKASVYKLVGSDWQLSGSEIEDGTEEKRNGTSVSLSRNGKTLAVGSVLGGGVRVYTLGVDWTGTHVPGSFGESVSLSSDGRTFVAGSKDEHKGRVYKYALGVGGWSRSTDTFDTIVAGEGSTTMLGKSVSLDGSGEVLCVSSNADVRIYAV